MVSYWDKEKVMPIEYWFEANPGASKWENIDNANVLGTKEGIVLNQQVDIIPRIGQQAKLVCEQH